MLLSQYTYHTIYHIPYTYPTIKFSNKYIIIKKQIHFHYINVISFLSSFIFCVYSCYCFQVYIFEPGSRYLSFSFFVATFVTSSFTSFIVPDSSCYSCLELLSMFFEFQFFFFSCLCKHELLYIILTAETSSFNNC